MQVLVGFFSDERFVIIGLKGVIMVILIGIVEYLLKGFFMWLTNILSFLHETRWGGLIMVFVPLNGVFMGLMTKGPWETKNLGAVSFVVAQAMFLAIYANNNVATMVIKVLAAQQLSYIVEHLLKIESISKSIKKGNGDCYTEADIYMPLIGVCYCFWHVSRNNAYWDWAS